MGKQRIYLNTVEGDDNSINSNEIQYIKNANTEMVDLKKRVGNDGKMTSMVQNSDIYANPYIKVCPITGSAFASAFETLLGLAEDSDTEITIPETFIDEVNIIKEYLPLIIESVDKEPNIINVSGYIDEDNKKVIIVTPDYVLRITLPLVEGNGIKIRRMDIQYF